MEAKIIAPTAPKRASELMQRKNDATLYNILRKVNTLVF